MTTNLQTSPVATEAPAHQRDRKTETRMIRLRPSDSLGDRLPAMHLVRSSWFARAVGRVLFWYLVLFVLASTMLPWQQSSRCEGVVTARNPNERRQFFLSPVKGIVTEQMAGLQEGTWVEKDDLLMVLKPISENEIEFLKNNKLQLEGQVKINKQALQQANDRIQLAIDAGEQEIQAAESKVKSTNSKWNQTKNEISEQQYNVNQAENKVRTFKSIVDISRTKLELQDAENKLSSENEKLNKLVNAAEQAYQDFQAEKSTLEEKKRKVEDNIAKARLDVNKLESDLADTLQKINKVSVELGELERNEIRSPNTGWVQSINVQVGRTVSNGESLFEIIPSTEDLWVELSVRGMDQPLVHVNDKVRIQFEGWPAIQFVGWPSAAKGTFGGVVNAINPADDGMGNFKIFVGPDPDDVTKHDWPSKDYLKQGVRANAWVLLDQVPLGFEIWRQVNGFPATRELGDKTKKESEAKAPKLK
jgi:multidrug resistance efflux pump